MPTQQQTLLPVRVWSRWSVRRTWGTAAILLLLAARSAPVFGDEGGNLDSFTEPPSSPLALDAATFEDLEEGVKAIPTADGSTWYQQNLLDAYLLVGERDPAWDKEATTALRMLAEEASGERTHSFSDRLEALHAARKAGCNDPLIYFLWARAYTRDNRMGARERRPYYQTAAMQMAQSPYGAFYKCGSFLHAAGAQLPLHKGRSETRRKNFDILMAACVTLLPSVFRDAGTPSEEICMLAGKYAEMHEWRHGSEEEGVQSMLKLMETHLPSESPVPDLFEGDFYKAFAWEARGSDWGFTVTPEMGHRHLERLDNAREAYLRAWEKDPCDAVTATKIMSCFAAIGELPEMERWFQRAMILDPNNYRACTIKANFLKPKWYGTQEQYLEFARTCYDTMNWDARLPFFLVDAHRQLGGVEGSPEAQAYYAKTNVWHDIRSVYEPYLSLHPEKTWDRTQYARYAVWCQQWASAKEQLDILGENVHARLFGGTNSLAHLRVDIDVHLGKGDSNALADVLPRDIIEAAAAGHVDELEQWLTHKKALRLRDSRGRSLLWHAVKHRQTAAADILLRRGATPNERDDGGIPLLIMAINRLDTEMIGLLLEHGAKPNCWDHKRDENALMVAIRRRHGLAVELLLGHGASLTSRNRKKYTPLHKAAKAGYPEIIRILAKAGADLEAGTSLQHTPLMIAADHHRTKAVLALLDLGADVNGGTHLDFTALVTASYRGHADIATILLQRGADPNLQNKDNYRTPLHYAAEGGHAEAVAVLLDGGADPFIQDKDGQTALDLARKRNRADVIALLTPTSEPD